MKLMDVLNDVKAKEIMDSYLDSINIKNPLDVKEAIKIIESSGKRPSTKKKLICYVNDLCVLGYRETEKNMGVIV